MMNRAREPVPDEIPDRDVAPEPGGCDQSSVRAEVEVLERPLHLYVRDPSSGTEVVQPQAPVDSRRAEQPVVCREVDAGVSHRCPSEPPHDSPGRDVPDDGVPAARSRDEAPVVAPRERVEFAARPAELAEDGQIVRPPERHAVRPGEVTNSELSGLTATAPAAFAGACAPMPGVGTGSKRNGRPRRRSPRTSHTKTLPSLDAE